MRYVQHIGTYEEVVGVAIAVVAIVVVGIILGFIVRD